MKKIIDIYILRILLMMVISWVTIGAYAATFTLPASVSEMTNFEYWVQNNGDGTNPKNALLPGSGSKLYAADQLNEITSYKYELSGAECTKTYKINDTRAIGFKVGANSQFNIKVYFVGQTGRSVQLLRDTSNSPTLLASQAGAGANSQNTNNLATLEYSINEEGTYWLTATGDVYFAGFEATKNTTIEPITADYAWQGSTSLNLGAGDLFGDNHFLNGTVAKGANQWNTINFNGDNSVPTYDYKTGDITTKIDADLTGIISVYYNDDAANLSYISESFTSPHPNQSAGSANGTTLTFNYTGSGDAPALGYVIDNENKSYTNSKFTASVICTDLPVILKVVYYNESNEFSTATSGQSSSNNTSYLSVDIPDGRKVYGFYVEAVTTEGQSFSGKQCTVEWARIEEHYTTNAAIMNGSYTVSGTPVTVDSKTKKVSYTFSTSAETTLTILGGNIGAIEVTNVRDSSTAPGLVAIEQDFLWYATTTGVNQGYGNGNKTYSTASLSVSTNNTVVNGVASHDAYDMDSGDAIGFKLKANTAYRVKIITRSAATNLLYEGKIEGSAAAVSGGYAQQIYGPGGGNPGTYYLTYDISAATTDRTYWIKAPAAGLCIGGFEVLPIHGSASNQNIPGINQLTTSDSSWTNEGSGGNKQSATGANGGSYYRLASGSTAHAYIYGPSMPLNAITLSGLGKTVLLNDGNRIGFRLPANRKVTIPYIGDTDGTLEVRLGDNFNSPSATKTASGNNTDATTLVITTEDATTLWVTAADHHYVYFAGLKLEVGEISTIDNAITSDYIWYPDGTLAEDTYTDVGETKYTYHKGTELAQSTSRIGIRNTWADARPFGYELADGQTIGFKVSTDHPCEINFYYHPDATINVYNCAKISDIAGKNPKSVSYTNVMKDGTIMATIKVSKSSGKTQTYWIQGEGLFGGFEVLFDNETNNTINRITNNDTRFDCGRVTANLTNALSNTNFRYLPSSNNWIYGPSRIYNACNFNSVPINKDKGIGFKLPLNTTLQVTVNYYGQSNATLRLVKGGSTSPSNASADKLAEFSGNTSGFAIRKSEILSASMVITTDGTDPVYWVTGSDNNLAYIQSINISTDILIPISSTHIYYIGTDATLTNKRLYDSQQLRYIGAEMTADTDTKISVPSAAGAGDLTGEASTTTVTTTTQITDQKDGDYYGIRIAKGIKGYIKIYYKDEEGANATIAKGTYDLNVADGYYPITSRISKKTQGGTVIMTMPFDYTASDVSQLYWISGNMKLGAIEVIVDNSAPVEPETGDGSHGYVYIKVDKNEPDFPYDARVGITYTEQSSAAKTGLIDIKNTATGVSNKTMTFMMGTKGVFIRRSNSKDGGKQMFLKGGMKWESQREAGNQGGFFDNIRSSYSGSNDIWSDSYHLDYTPDQYEVNANPQTECNSGLGGISTENGGMFLQPVSGDFFRMEPEYDGVVTLYILQNGNTDGNTSRTGQITRRPVYIMDENGKIMKRSRIKPSFDFTTKSQYAIDGTWMDLNSWAPIRSDYEEAWAKAKELWQEGTLSPRYQETMRFYDFWYDGGTYDFDNPDDKVTLKDWEVNTTKSGNTYTYSSATELTLKDEIGLPYYRNDKLWELENNSTNNLLVSGENDFAKYGYEVPVHIHVRYVFPVKAGKSYYLGGRGTKNAFMAVKFQPMPANYNNTDYIIAGYNYDVNENTSTGKYALTNITTSGSQVEIDYDTDYTTSYSGTGYPTMSLNGAENSTDLSWDNENKTVDFTLTDRDFTADQWYPIVLPFSVSETRMRQIFGNDVQVLYLDPYDHSMDRQSIGTKGQDGYEYWISALSPAVKNNKLRFTYHYYQMLYANTPAFIRPSDDVKGPIEFSRVHLEKANLGTGNAIGYKIGEAGYYDYWVVGSYVSTTGGTDNKEMYYLDNVDGKAVMYHSRTGVDMKPTRCWIAIKDRRTGLFCAPGRETQLSEIGFASYEGTPMEGLDEVSGIEDIVMDDTTADMYNDGNVYDLMGRKVAEGSLDDLLPGVYIYQGRKIYIR